MPGDIAEDMKTLPVFIRRYNDSKSFADMIHGYRELTGGYNYAIENLTELPADERFMRISSVIIAKKKALYPAYKMSEGGTVNCNAYLVEKNNYIVVLSTDANHIYGKRVLKSTFRTTEYEPIGVLGKKKVHVYLTTRFYQGILPKIGSDIARFKDERNKNRSNVRTEASFTVSPELAKAMLEYNKRGPDSLKACVVVTLGKIVCKLIQRDAIIIKTRHEGGMLRWVPMIFNSDDDYSEQYNDIKDLYEKAETFDSCSVDILNAELRYDCEEYSTLSYEFLTDDTYNDFIRRVESDTTYFIDAYGRDVAPISVRLEINRDSMNIIYSCDKGYLGNVDVSKINDMFTVLISRIVAPKS